MTQLEEDLYNILKADTTPIIERAQMLHIFFVQMLKNQNGFDYRMRISF